MLLPEFESIKSAVVSRFGRWVAEDVDDLELPDLQTAEEQVVAFVRELGPAMLQRFVSARYWQATAARPRCGCGHQEELHRSTPWIRQGPLGPVTVRDVYTYCGRCRKGSRPLHAWLGTDREPWSLSVQEAAVDLASDESCQKAVKKLERHHPGVQMGRTTALRLLHEHGAKARQFIDAKLERAQSAASPDGQPRTVVPELEVEFDAGMIPVATLEPVVPEGGESPPAWTPVRKLLKRHKVCRWEEVKAGLVQQPGEPDRLYSVRPTTALDESFDDLLRLARLKGWTEQTQVRGLADGARHIRPRMEETFQACAFRFILDRPHCKEHLSTAGEALCALTGLPAQVWARQALTRMEAGQAEQVVAELKAAHAATGNETLRLEAAYFERNRDAVAYAEYRQRGWSTASSEIESAHTHVVQVRLKISGAWWHPDKVDDVLALRMLKANGWWDEYWAQQRAAWSARAATFIASRPFAAVPQPAQAAP